MNRRTMLVFVSLLVMMSMLLGACGGGAEPTAAPASIPQQPMLPCRAADATKVATAAAAAADAASADATKVAMEAAAAADTASADATKVAEEAAALLRKPRLPRKLPPLLLPPKSRPK